jgi:hypothetical protein
VREVRKVAGGGDWSQKDDSKKAWVYPGIVKILLSLTNVENIYFRISDDKSK